MASLIPNKKLFIVSSALESTYGAFDHNTRFEQTIKTIDSIRRNAPGSIICIFDSSPSLSVEKAREIEKYVEIFVPLQSNPGVVQLSRERKQSPAECLSTFSTLMMLKQNVETSKILKSVNRVFKISGRYELRDSFDMKTYDNPELFGKYVFRKRYPSWMPIEKQQQTGATDLLVTRLYSFCTSLYDDFLITLPNIFKICYESNIDLEHGMFRYINKEHLIEFDEVHCQGKVANTGEMHYD